MQRTAVGGRFVTKRSDLGFLLILLIVFVLLELGGNEFRASLQYERALIAGGEIWRLLTGHFVHLGWSHLLMNAASLAVMLWVFADSTARDGALRLWWLPTIVLALSISVLFLLLVPKLHWYVGFSGVLHGFIVIALWRGKPYWPAINWWVLVIAVTAKLLYEAMFGAMPGSADLAGGPVATAAHLAGALSGVAYCAVWWLVARVTSDSPTS